MNRDSLSGIRHRRPIHSQILDRIKQYIFRNLTRRSLGLFFRGGDIISIAPQTTGAYDADINHLVDHFIERGHNDFLIDIGANIGLMSCQNGHKFQNVHMYEPNPICVEVLRANCMIMLNATPYQIHPCALSEADGSDTLRIPKHNWGGAFIHRGNAYSDDLLSRKDGFDSLADANYLVLNVQLRAANVELKQLFDGLLAKGLRRGVIKIDVEGYEEKILGHLIDVMPKAMESFLILESWDSKSGIANVAKGTTRPIDIYKYTSTTHLLNISSLASSFSTIKKLQPIKDEDWRGDIIVHLKSQTF